MLNFEEFQEYAKNHVKDYLGDDLQDAEVSLQKVQKNNGLELHGILVKDKATNIAPTIYLEGYFKNYEEGQSLDAVLSNIATVAETHQLPIENGNDIIANFTNFEFIKEHIVMAAVNAKDNAEMLRETPYTMKEDLALIYKVMIDSDAQGISTITIKNNHLEYWNTSVEELHEFAMQNSNRLLPETTRAMNDVMREMLANEMPPEMLDLMMEEMPVDNQMFVISNQENLNGASAIFYSDALEKLADKIGTDLYILPSSVHEVIAVSTNMGDPESLADMVQEVNGTQVSVDERLSDHVYHYDAKNKEITLADTSVEQLAKEAPIYAANVDMGRRAAAR